MKVLPSVLALAKSTTASACPSTECWSFDEASGSCTLKEGCASISCSSDSMEVKFSPEYFGIGEDSASLFPNAKFKNGQYCVQCNLGDCGMTAASSADGDINFSLELSQNAGSAIHVGDLELYDSARSASLTASCVYDSTVSVSSQDYDVVSAVADGELSANGDLTSAFSLNLFSDQSRNTAIDGLAFIGARVWADIEWSADQELVKFYVSDCSVNLGGARAVSAQIIKDNCYSNALGVTKTGPVHEYLQSKKAGFTFNSFSSDASVQSQEVKVTCDVKLCVNGEENCAIQTETCADADAEGYNYTPTGCAEHVNVEQPGSEICQHKLDADNSTNNEDWFWDCPGDLTGCIGGDGDDCSDALNDCTSFVSSACLEALASCAVELELCLPTVASSCLFGANQDLVYHLAEPEGVFDCPSDLTGCIGGDLAQCASAKDDCLGWVTEPCMGAITACISGSIESCIPKVAQNCILGAISPEYSTTNEDAFWDCPGDLTGCIGGDGDDCSDALSDCTSLVTLDCLEALGSCADDLELCLPTVASSCIFGANQDLIGHLAEPESVFDCPSDLTGCIGGDLAQCASAKDDCLGWVTEPCMGAITACISGSIESCIPKVAQNCILGAISPEYSTTNE